MPIFGNFRHKRASVFHDPLLSFAALVSSLTRKLTIASRSFHIV